MSQVYLAHHGILGQKWGVRRYQNPNGSLTDAGKKRYNKISSKYNKQLAKSKIENIDIQRSRAKYKARLKNNITELEAKNNAKNSTRIEKKIDKKKTRLADQKAGDKRINAGLERYDKTISKYRDMKLEAITNPDIKKTEKYKKIKSDYLKQKFIDLNYGSNFTKFMYADDYSNPMAKNQKNANKNIPVNPLDMKQKQRNIPVNPLEMKKKRQNI